MTFAMSTATNLSIFVGHFTGNDGHNGQSSALQTFEDVEITGLMVVGCGNGFRRFRIPDNTIAIRANSDSTFLRVDIEDTGSVGTGHRHELIDVQFARFHALRPDHCKTIFDTVDTVGNLTRADRETRINE